MTAPPRKRPRSVSVSAPAERSARPRLLDPREAGGVERLPDARERQRLVEAEPEHDALPRADGLVERLELALGRPARRERLQVAPELRRVPPALALDCRDRADPDAEVVVGEPVAEVVPRAEVASRLGAAEVGRLVPAVAGAAQPGDDALEVVLHRVGLPGQLLSPGVGEARPRLRLELVAGEVLRLERERVAEVGLEVGGALAGDPVDEIERDVVKSGITEMMHGAPDVVRAGNTLEHLQQLRPEGLGAERNARHACARAARAPAPPSPSRGSPRPSPPPRPAAPRAAARARGGP